MRFRSYYYLIKPGIVYGNALTAAAGFFLGSGQSLDPFSFICVFFGLSFIVASGCVFNNIIDRDIDSKMLRTKDRALVRGVITPRAALLYGAALGILGTILLVSTSVLAAAVALFGLFMYVVVYSLWSKRNTLHGTLIGAVSGAVPPVVGYAAARGELDTAAFVLFLILFSWQMPHALAIAIRRYNDYEAAAIPVMPIVRSVFSAKLQMAVYVFVFTLAALTLPFTGIVSNLFGIVLGISGLLWLAYGIYGFQTHTDEAWAKNMFLYSLVTNLLFCFLSVLSAFTTYL